jgi:hypothetical protein
VVFCGNISAAIDHNGKARRSANNVKLQNQNGFRDGKQASLEISVMIVLAFNYVTDLKKTDQNQQTRKVTTRAGLSDKIQGSPQ